MMIEINSVTPGSQVQHFGVMCVILSIKKRSHFLWSANMLRNGVIQRLIVEPTYLLDVTWSPNELHQNASLA